MASVGEDVEKGNPRALLAGVQTGNSMTFPQMIKTGPPLQPSDSTSRDLSKETRNTHLKE